MKFTILTCTIQWHCTHNVVWPSPPPNCRIFSSPRNWLETRPFPGRLKPPTFQLICNILTAPWKRYWILKPCRISLPRAYFREKVALVQCAAPFCCYDIYTSECARNQTWKCWCYSCHTSMGSTYLLHGIFCERSCSYGPCHGNMKRPCAHFLWGLLLRVTF